MLSSSKVVWINGSFHLLSPAAAGDILLPFKRRSRETDSGKLHWALTVLSACGVAAGVAAVGEVVSGTWAVLEQVGSLILALSPFPESSTEIPLVCLTPD